MRKEDIRVGMHRPVYLWGGPGTVRMNRLKFMGAPVDEAVHHEAHTAAGAQRMAEAGFNWAYLMYDWGFPPEVERQDWEDFARAVQVYHQAGLRVFGYVQASNCAYQGSYREQDWYARDPRGRLVYYYTGRHMTCWRHPEWGEHLREMTRGVLAAGAEGVFYDNPWHGAQPLGFLGAWAGGAGCYCPDCRAAFRRECGDEIPARLQPESDAASRAYLRWRAGEVTRTLTALAEHARALNPAALVSVNDFDAVLRPSYLIYGIDLQALAGVQDVLMIEDYGLPRWEPREGLLVNNALTLRTARALAGETPVTTDPYDRGIGFDGVYPPRRFVQGVAEAAACGAPMVVKGTEFVEAGAFTLLTAERYAPQRAALGELHAWLQSHAGLYDARRNCAPIGLLFPGEELWLDWNRLAPGYFGTGQALLAEGLPWRVVSRERDLEGLGVLLAFDAPPPGWRLPDGLRVLDVHALPGWAPPRPAPLARHAWLHAPVTGAVAELFRAYFTSRLARRLIDGLGLAHFFMGSPLYRLPPAARRRALLAALGEVRPRVLAGAPVLLEVWEGAGRRQLHLVNYALEPQQVSVQFERPARGRVLAPGAQPFAFEGSALTIRLESYAVVLEG